MQSGPVQVQVMVMVMVMVRCGQLSNSQLF